jgi:hypothetical protein
MTFPAAEEICEAKSLSVPMASEKASFVRLNDRREVFDVDDRRARCKKELITVISSGIRLFQA